MYKYQQFKSKHEAVCLKVQQRLVDIEINILTGTGREFNNSPPSCTEVKNQWSYTSAPHICLDVVDKEDFTFILTDMHSTRCCSVEPLNHCRRRLLKFMCKLDKNLCNTVILHPLTCRLCLQSAFFNI
jgi:hypothetical protein